MSITLVKHESRHASSGIRISNLRDCRLAIIVCCPLDGLKSKLSINRLQNPFLYNIDVSSQYIATLGESKILIVETGMQTNIKDLIDEITGLGIKNIIGFGPAESMTNQIPAGQIVLSEAAITVEQTSCKFSYPHHGLFHDLRMIASKRCLSLRRAKTMSVDISDSDFIRKINAGRSVGAEVVSNEATSLYSAARFAGASCVYICMITGGQRGRLTGCESRDNLHDLVIALAKNVVSSMNVG
jgi:purine-nucleoside phosphorylase